MQQQYEHPRAQHAPQQQPPAPTRPAFTRPGPFAPNWQQQAPAPAAPPPPQAPPQAAAVQQAAPAAVAPERVIVRPPAPPAALATATADSRPLLTPFVAAPVVTHQRSVLAFDVIGGVVFAILVGMVMASIGSALFVGSSWAASIGWESVWLVACLVCAPLMPSGVRHVIDVRSTIEGIKLDWPEMLMATWVLLEALQYGAKAGWLGPLGLALAVGAAEEFLFRVLILGWLVTRLDTAAALLVSAAVFGLAHLNELSLIGMMSVVPQFAGGILLGAVYLRTRNPIGPIIAHAYWDFPYFLALGNEVSGGGTEAGMPGVGSVLFWMAFGVYGLWLVRAGVPAPGRDEPVLHRPAATTN